MYRPPPNTLIAVVALIIASVVAAPSAIAKSNFSSGGYSRPSSFGSTSRTPSTGGMFSVRTPSTSGGYSRPSTWSQGSSQSAPMGSSTDRSLARQSSREALNAYRQSQSTEAYSRRPQTDPIGPWDGGQRRTSIPATSGDWNGWQRYPAGPAPGYSRYGQQNGSGWSTLLLWSLLNSLDRPGHAEFFHHHQDDPGYLAWRAQADAKAKDDPQVRQNLAELDSRLTVTQDQPRDRNYMPPDAATGAPKVNSSDSSSDGNRVLFLLLVVCAGVAYLGWRSLSGDIAARKSPMFKNPLSKQPYRPQWFRIGMVLPFDPSLFILAGQCTHIRSPSASGSGQISVESLGELSGQELVWHRLYLQGEDYFFQVHLDARGQPDECRYFSKLDEVDPASQEEWGFWLDPQEGQIGWPEFQTKDGKTYQRIGSTGAARISPYEQHETVSSTSGTRQLTHQAMLYGTSTGVAAPAPTTEYMLVSAIDDGSRAWVAISAGVDVSVSALNLS